MADAESAAEEQTELVMAFFVRVSVFSLFIYDYILNLAKEIDLIWHSPLHVTTGFYIVCRYFPFVGLIFDLATVEVGFGRRPIEVCNRVRYFMDVFRTIDRVAVNGVLCIQTSALYNHNRRLLAILVLFGVAVTTISSYQFTLSTCSYDPPDDRPIIDIVTLLFQTIFPIVILILNLWKATTLAGLRHKLHPKSRSGQLTSVIIFQTLCLTGVCIFRVFNALWYFLAPTAVNLSATPFLLPLGGILIVHYLLSLREVGGDNPADSMNSMSGLLSTIIPPLPVVVPSAEPIADSFSSVSAYQMKLMGQP